VRWGFSVGAVASAMAPALLVPLPACLSSSTSSPDGGSGSSSSGSSSGATDSGSATQATCLGPDLGPLGMNCIIDDMTGTPTQSGGYWYTFSDRTVPFGTMLVPGYQGTVDPPEGMQFLPNNVPATGLPMPGPGPTIPGLSMPADIRTFAGENLTLWGAGMGFDFLDQVPADASAPSPDAGGDGGGVLGVPTAFDGSAHNGIAFWGRSNLPSTAAAMGNQVVGIHLADQRQAAGGTVCDAGDPYTVFDGGADINKNPTECGVDFVKNQTFTPAWTYFHITWAQFGKSQNYSGGTIYPSVDQAHLFYLHFQVNNPGYAGMGPIAPEPLWSISVAYVTWYDGM